MSEELQFQAEVSSLLDIVANALYSEREIFLRELISNASDACDKLRYAAVTDAKLVEGDANYRIQLIFDPEARTLTIADNGIGMDKSELIKNLGTIAHSGTSEMLSEIVKSKKDDKEQINLIGQFGVGFYSAFMVSDKVEVLSRKAGAKVAHQWVSDGKGSFTVDESLKDTRGTEITLYLKEDAGEFLLEERLKHIVKTYSEHICFPIIFGSAEDGPVLNAASAIWTRSKKDLTEDEYSEFYHHVSGAMAMDKPWLTMHWKAEGAIEYTNLLYIPEMKPFDLYDPKRHHGVKLYVKRVYITDGIEGLVPPFLRFLKGVVDSEDLPLNISREVLQNNPVVAKISTALTKRVLDELSKCAEDNPSNFEQFWAQFGPVVKEGLYDAHQYRDKLLKVVRFYSTKSDSLISLQEYVDRMQEGQDKIYYISGSDIKALRNSPQLEGFKAKDVEVLLMADSIDEFWLPIQINFAGKDFKSVTKGDTGLENIGADEAEIKELAEKKASKKKAEDAETDVEENAVIAKLQDILGKEVKSVCFSSRLTESPVCLVADDGGTDMHMERMLKNQQGYEALSLRVLEINESHPVIKTLEKLVANDGEDKDSLLNDAAYLLLDQARIVEGDPLPDPSAFARRMSRMMEYGLLA